MYGKKRDTPGLVFDLIEDSKRWAHRRRRCHRDEQFGGGGYRPAGLPKMIQHRQHRQAGYLPADLSRIEHQQIVAGVQCVNDERPSRRDLPKGDLETLDKFDVVRVPPPIP